MDGGGVAADVLVQAQQVVLGRLDLGRQLQGLRLALEPPAQPLQVGLAALQGVAALVGEAGHRLADGRQPLRLQRLPLGLLQFRDVVADQQEPRAARAGLRQRLGRPGHGPPAPVPGRQPKDGGL